MAGHNQCGHSQRNRHCKGYSIKPFLPFVLGINQDQGLGLYSCSFQVEDEYNEKIRQLRHDYFRVLNELYQDYHLKVIKAWANMLDMKYAVIACC